MQRNTQVSLQLNKPAVYDNRIDERIIVDDANFDVVNRANFNIINHANFNVIDHVYFDVIDHVNFDFIERVNFNVIRHKFNNYNTEKHVNQYSTTENIMRSSDCNVVL
ncbi:hypothetical protein Aduo_007826 [Ancylostoma duodenale]